MASEEAFPSALYLHLIDTSDSKSTLNKEEFSMSTCHTCGNTYDKTFEVQTEGKSYTFDCFECAIYALAPTCAGCGVRILGHGLQHDSTLYCCRHCAEQAGVTGLRDRI